MFEFVYVFIYEYPIIRHTDHNGPTGNCLPGTYNLITICVVLEKIKYVKNIKNVP